MEAKDGALMAVFLAMIALTFLAALLQWGSYDVYGLDLQVWEILGIIDTFVGIAFVLSKRAPPDEV